MNLTVEQMDVLNFRLTEVAMELLGNSFYDIFGQNCDSLPSLYRSKTSRTNNKTATDTELVEALKVQHIFNSCEEPPGGSRVINDWSNLEQTGDFESDTDDAGDDDDGESKRLNDVKITRIISEVEGEYERLSMASESSKLKYFIANRYRMGTEKETVYDICEQFHKEENSILMAQSDAFIKLIKFIKSDPLNESKIGEIAANILKVKDVIISVASAASARN